MIDDMFLVAFLLQVIVLTVYFPGRIYNRLGYVMTHYPPSDFPRLYPQPLSHYEAERRNYLIKNVLVGAIGLVLLSMFSVDTYLGDWERMLITGFFLVQLLPVIHLDLLTLRRSKLMRELLTDGVRKAEMRPRHVHQFVSSGLLGGAIATYLGFIVLVVYVNQFDYEWFGGYLNLVIITGLNVLFVAVGYWTLTSKRKDPYQAYQDRLVQMEMTIRTLVFVSIAATWYVALSILLSAIQLDHLESIAICIYHVVLGLICMQPYSISRVDFDVYREPATA
ncbi:MAG: hypothetical protein AAF525_22540 [Pseudomonadota bacterium]